MSFFSYFFSSLLFILPLSLLSGKDRSLVLWMGRSILHFTTHHLTCWSECWPRRGHLRLWHRLRHCHQQEGGAGGELMPTSTWAHRAWTSGRGILSSTHCLLVNGPLHMQEDTQETPTLRRKKKKLVLSPAWHLAFHCWGWMRTVNRPNTRRWPWTLTLDCWFHWPFSVSASGTGPLCWVQCKRKRERQRQTVRQWRSEEASRSLTHRLAREREEEQRRKKFERKEMTSLLLMWRHLDDSTCCVSWMHAQNLSLFPLFRGAIAHTGPKFVCECAVTGPGCSSCIPSSLTQSLTVPSIALTHLFFFFWVHVTTSLSGQLPLVHSKKSHNKNHADCNSALLLSTFDQLFFTHLSLSAGSSLF